MKWLVLILVLGFTLQGAGQKSTKILVDKIWAISVVESNWDSARYVCHPVHERTQVFQVGNKGGFIFKSDGTFEELMWYEKSHGRKPYKGKWELKRKRVKVVPDEENREIWYFEIIELDGNTLSVQHLVGDY